MANRNEELVRQAYQTYTRGDLDGLLDLVDPDLEWTYLNPAFADPRPATCHGRDQLRAALQRQAATACPPSSKRWWPAGTPCW